LERFDLGFKTMAVSVGLFFAVTLVVGGMGL